MFRLIKKDLVSGFIFLLIFPIAIPLMTVMAIWMMLDDFGGLIVAVITFITMGLCIAPALLFFALDSARGVEAVFASLPVKRSTIVCARYCSVYLITVSAFFVVLLTCFAAVYLFGAADPAFGLLLSVRGVWSMIFSLLLVLSFIQPFIFRYGFEKGSIAVLFTLVGMAVTVLVIDSVLKALNGIVEFDPGFFNSMIMAALTGIKSLKSTPAYLAMIAALVVLTGFSSALSVRFYRLRDL